MTQYGNLNSLPLALSKPIDLAGGHIYLSDNRDVDYDVHSGKSTVVHHSSTSTLIPRFIKIRRKSVDGRTDIESGFIRSPPSGDDII